MGRTFCCYYAEYIWYYDSIVEKLLQFMHDIVTK